MTNLESVEAGRLPDFSEYSYDQMTPEAIEAIKTSALEYGDALIEQVVNCPYPSHDTVIAPQHDLNSVLRLAGGKIHLMSNVHPDATVREVAHQSEIEIDKWCDDTDFREDLYEVIKAYAETDEAKQLEGEHARFLKDTLDGYHRQGMDLDPESRETMHQLQTELSEACTTFRKNINEDNSQVAVTPEQLEGLPDDYIAGLEQDDEGNMLISVGKYPQVGPFLKLATNREARARVSDAKSSRVVEVNRELLSRAVEIRQQMAQLLGYESWAELKLDDRMAKTVDAVGAMYDRLIDPLTEKAQAELAVMTELLHQDGYEGELQVHDTGYYSDQLRKTEYAVDHEKIAEYFPIDQVIDGLLEVTGETFGLQYRELRGEPTWHEDVKAYAIDDAESGEELAKFYLDLFPREGKYTHGATTNIVKGRHLDDGSYRHPESVIMTNFTEPTADAPALLKHSEVTTLFHEFGHVLHQCLTKAELGEMSGTAVERDFVEAPSQIMERWVLEPTVLARFARHYQTGEVISTELIEKLVASQNLNVGLSNLSQITLGSFDMAIHDSSDNKDVEEIWRRASSVGLLPSREGTFMPSSFGHLMGGYDAGYYGYLWAEVYGHDMFEQFKANGLTNSAVGMEYRHKILEKGGTVDAIDMLKDFLGREPSDRAFLEQLGIAEQ